MQFSFLTMDRVKDDGSGAGNSITKKLAAGFTVALEQRASHEIQNARTVHARPGHSKSRG